MCDEGCPPFSEFHLLVLFYLRGRTGRPRVPIERSCSTVYYCYSFTSLSGRSSHIRLEGSFADSRSSVHGSFHLLDNRLGQADRQNYPWNLNLSPLVGAIAAGCPVILKVCLPSILLSICSHLYTAVRTCAGLLSSSRRASTQISRPRGLCSHQWRGRAYYKIDGASVGSWSVPRNTVYQC